MYVDMCVCEIFNIQKLSACLEFQRDKQEYFQTSSTTRIEMTSRRLKELKKALKVI